MKPSLYVLPFAALLSLTAAATQRPTFSVRVDLVTVDALVTVNKQPVSGLKVTDFELRDNGVLQRVDTVTDAGLQTVPLDIVLTLDSSGSMAGVRLQQLIEAGRGVLERLRPIDRAALVTFSDRTLLEHDLSSKFGAIWQSLENITAAARTSMFDALYVALTRPRAAGRRSMVLLFSDGRDNSSWLSGKDVLEIGRQSDSVVYAVGLDESVRAQVKDLVNETGGQVVIAESAEQLKTLFVRLLQEMQARYVLTYYPQRVTREGWHTIEVRVPGRNAEIKARRGYYVAGS